MRPGFTLTVTEPGVLPLPGVTLSHEPPEAAAENEAVPLASETVSFCDAGNEPPAYLKDNDVGFAVSAPEVVGLLTVTLTVVEWLKLPEVPVTVTPMVIAAAELVAEMVSVLVPVPLIAPNVADKPVGKPGGEKLTVLGLKPPAGVIVSVVAPLDPGATVKLLGDADKLKLGATAAAVTVTLTVAVWLRLPEVPVMVTVVGPPVVAVLLAVRVRVFAVNDAVTPLGKPDAAYVTVPVKPFDGVTVIMLDPLAPCAILTLLGDADRLKLGGTTAAVTVTPTVAVWLRLPEVPVTVTVVGPPVVAVPLAVRVSVFPVNDAVTPLGKPDAAYVTVPVKPFFGVTVIVLEPLAPCAILTLVGDGTRLKSGVAAAACETADVVE